jgi:hypothetical protein
MKESVLFWRSAGILGWLALLAVVLACFVDSLYSTSIDIGLHGTLVSRLMDSWQLPQADENLAEMADYPRIAHLVASVPGSATGSAMTGMQVAATGSAFFLWSMVGIGLAGLPSLRFLAVIAALGIAIFFARLVFDVEIFGNELVSTYFFSHLFSQSLAMAAMVFALRKEWTGSNLLVPYAILGVSAPLLASVHLLPAVEMLGMLAILVALNALNPHAAERKNTAWSGLGIVVVSTLLTVVNPDFLAMVRLSANDGGMLLHYATSLEGVLVLAFLVVVVSCFMLFLWWRASCSGADYRHLLLKYFGAFGLAVAGLCLLQLFLYEVLGQASPYACFKYVIGLQSILLIDATLLVTLRVRSGNKSDLPGARPLASGLLAALACISVFSGPVALDTGALVSAEREARALARPLSRDHFGKHDLAIGIDDVPPIGSYFISRAVLGSPSLGMTLDVLFGRMPQPIEHVGRILTSAQSRPWDVPECRQENSGKLVVIDAACALASMGNLKCEGTIPFSGRGTLDRATTGFPNASSEGRWSEGPQATFACELIEPYPSSVYVSAAGLVTDAHRQRMIVSVNGERAQTVEFSTRSASSTTRIPLPASARGRLVLQFSFPDAISPAELGMNADQRKLAVMIFNIRFE